MGILSQNLSSKFEGRVRKGQKQLPYPPRAKVLKRFYGSQECNIIRRENLAPR